MHDHPQTTEDRHAGAGQPYRSKPGFEQEWRSRFIEFADLRDDDAGIAGWSTTGLDARFRFFRSLWRGAVRAYSRAQAPRATELLEESSLTRPGAQAEAQGAIASIA